MPAVRTSVRRAAAAIALGLLAAVPVVVAAPVAPRVSVRLASSAWPLPRAEGVVRGTSAPGAIPGSYVVVLKPGRDVRVSAAGLVGSRLGRTFPALSAFSAGLSALQARQLAANPAVDVVEQDRVVRLAAATYRRPVWNLDRIDQRSRKRSRTYTPMDDGSAVHAYVIDTGVRISHADLRGRASYGWDFIGGDAYAGDCNGHGTHVAATLGGSRYGVAKRVRLVAVRVLDCLGDGSLSTVIDGVNWVTQHAVKPAVANMSLGSDRSAALEYAVARSIASGVTYAVAAGNENVNASTVSPAAVTAAITVGATDAKDRRAPFSNYGSRVDLFAPGVNIRSAYGLGDTMVANLSGTSMATPQVAGAAALVLDAFPSWSPSAVRDYLVRRATTGKVTKRGKGSPNRLLYIPRPPARVGIRTASLPAGGVGVAYRRALALTGGRRGTWRVLGGTPPAGLRLSPSGVLAGTPTAPGSWRMTVGFTDFVPDTSTRTLTVTVKLTAPSITTTTLPEGTDAAAYITRLRSGGNRPGTWSLAGGALPAGLSLSAAGELTGIPSGAGTYGFDVRFTDAWHQPVTRTLQLILH